MLISITAPKKGLGQTQSAINIAGMITKLIDGNVLLGDINQYSQDIEYYFSDTHALKGLDSLISLINSNLLNNETFETCVKTINDGLDIMIANECFDLNEEIIKTMFNYTNKKYNVTVFDTISGSHTTTRELFEVSDVIVVVLNQYKNVLDLVVQNKLYHEYKDKLVFLVNRHRNDVNLSVGDIKGVLKETGISSEVFPVDYETTMINECNDHSVLNYILNYNVKSASTHQQILQAASFLLEKFGKGLQLKEVKVQSKGLLSFFKR